MSKEKELIVVKEGFFRKISNFFKGVFMKKGRRNKGKGPIIQEVSYNYERANSKQSFFEELKVKEDTEKEKLVTLQEMIRNKEIEEQNISQEDAKQLRKLYNQQISELEEKIKKYRDSILDIQNKLQTKTTK